MRKWVRNTLYGGGLLLAMGVGAVGGVIGGYLGSDAIDGYLARQFDIGKSSEDYSLVLGVEVNRGTRESPDWQPYRVIGVEDLNFEDRSATGTDNGGRHLRAKVQKYDPFGFAKESIASSNAP